MPDWQQAYQDKLTTAERAAELVQPGDSIYSAGLSAIPRAFADAVAARADELIDVDYYAALSPYPLKVLDGDLKGKVNYHTIFTGPFERMKAHEGNINQMSVHLAEVDRFLQERAQPTILAVNVSPPDKHGYMTYGPCGGLGQAAAREIVKTVQAERRAAGLDVSDRIRLTWDSTSDDVVAAMTSHADYVAAEVLAVAVSREPGGVAVDVDGEVLSLSIDRHDPGHGD